MFGLELLAKLFKVLRSGESPNQIAAGFILGMIPGLTPIWNFHNLIVLILLIILRVNFAAAIFSFILFSAFAYIFDPLFHSLGYYFLVEQTSLHDFWNTFFNTPLLGLSNLNNTVVLGSFIVSLLLLIPMFFLMKKFIIVYRERIDSRLQKLKIVQAIKGSKIYTWYEKIKNLGG
jgi:uncharacterized protein (TIGR03546 family)